MKLEVKRIGNSTLLKIGRTVLRDFSLQLLIFYFIFLHAYFISVPLRLKLHTRYITYKY